MEIRSHRLQIRPIRSLLQIRPRQSPLTEFEIMVVYRMKIASRIDMPILMF